MQRRVERKRPAPSGLDAILDDRPLPAWRDLPGNDDEQRGNTSEIAELAATLEAKYYRRDSLKFWPKDFGSRAKHMDQQDKRSFRRIRDEVQKALTAYLIDELSALELKLMLLLMNRTLNWSKFWEGIPFSHVADGVFIKGRLVQARITGNKTHFIEAVEDLVSSKLIRESTANTENGPVRILSINVGGILDRAQSVIETATKPTFGRQKLRGRLRG